MNALVEDHGDGIGPGSGREQKNLPTIDGMTQEKVALVEQRSGGNGSEGVVAEGEVNVADGPLPAAYDALPVAIVTPASPSAEHQGFALGNRERPVAGRDSSQMRDVERGLPSVAAPESPSFGRQSSFAATNEVSGFLSTATQAALFSRPRAHSLPEDLRHVVERRACGERAGGDNFDDDEDKIQEVGQTELNAVDEQPRSSLVRKRRLSGGATSQAKIYRCEQCMQSFARSYNLKSHSLIHSNERPFLCEVCGTAFSRQHDLKRHAKLHTGEKPYRCGHCDRAFSRLDALNRHIRAEDVKNCAGGVNAPCASQYSFTAHSNKQEAQAHVQYRAQDESGEKVGHPLIVAGGTLRVLPTSTDESVSLPHDGRPHLITPPPKRAYGVEAAEQHWQDRRRQVVNTAGGLPHSQALWWFPVTHTYKAPGPNRPPSQEQQPQQYHAQPMPVQSECSQRMCFNEHQQAVGQIYRHVSNPPEHAPASKAVSVPTATSNSPATPDAPLSGLPSDGYAHRFPRGSPGRDEVAAAMEDNPTQAIRNLTAERDLIVDRVVFLEGQLAVERNTRKRLHALEAQVQQLEIEKRLLQSMIVGQTNHAFPLPVAGLHRYPAGGAIGFVAYDPGVTLPSLPSSTPRPSSP